MLRANLWLQMEQVGEFVQSAEPRGQRQDLQFKAQVERLAHQLGVMTQRAKSTAAPAQRSGTKPPSTITVGTLLNGRGTPARIRTVRRTAPRRNRRQRDRRQ